ncbi:HAD family hydrolase [Sandaracinus amylolyticus]|uniref:HAD family hydrolase n=1 Tax=Sandaracinus amylolyticus TaxID=927083 RepID=UPI001F26ACEE|nr:HAD family hydrolase [Sandaracinus amylolyticus]UJR81194.1 Phosphoserine phosphatase [Sandaracinus amylolyticus]
MSGARAAFFDMDKTLVRVNTGRLYASWRFSRGETRFRDLLRVSWWSLQYTLGVVDADAVSRYAARTLAGVDERAFADECRAWYASAVRPHVTGRARSEVEQRHRDGYVVAILTGSSPYVAGPLADELGIDHVISSRLVVESGCFTGDVEALCYGPGKVTRALEWAARHEVDLAASAFYTDSLSDLPMLERVGEPRIVNPDPRLRALAKSRGWPIEIWT